jgi:hypothetical protein
MKLTDFSAVADLIKERDYLRLLRTKTELSQQISIGGLHVRPDICDQMRPEMVLIFNQQIAIVDEKLAALGVTTETETVV